MLFTLDYYTVIIFVGIYFIVFSINQYYVDQFQKYVLYRCILTLYIIIIF